MRLIILLAALFITTFQFSNAQKDTTKEEYDSLVTQTIDGKNIVWGTTKEYRDQQSLSSTGKIYGNPYLCRFIGYKYYYLFHLTNYMDDHLKLTVDKSFFDKKSGLNTFVLVPHIGNGKETKTYIKAVINNDERVISLSITGDLYNLSYLFLWFWPSTSTTYSKSNFVKGKFFYKYVLNEKISFDWTGTYPVLKITKEKGTLGQ